MEKELNPLQEQEKQQQQETAGDEAEFWRDAKYSEDKNVSER